MLDLCIPNKVIFSFHFIILDILHVHDSRNNNFRELGIGIVSYSPLGRGFLGGKAVTENLATNSFLV